MLEKALVIGVGGSGGKTLRYLWQELDRRLRATGWMAGVPSAWSFLHIDVPEHPDVVEADVPAAVGQAITYLGLAKAPDDYFSYDELVCGREDALAALVGWRPDPRVVAESVTPYKGAGQRRVVGRMVALARLQEVGDAIDQAVRSLKSPDTAEELAALNRHLGLPVSAAKQPTAFLISSLGGGSGSGSFLDVIELLVRRRMDDATAWLSEHLVTVLFTSEVFGHMKKDEREQIEGNTLGAVSELLAAFEHEGPVPASQNVLVAAGGGRASLDGRRSGRTNLFVGARNQALELGDSFEVYRTTASALACLIANEAVNDKFGKYLDNVAARSVTPAFGITRPGRPQAASSLGYASVQLGRPLFAQYCEERLAKRVLERLQRGHREEADLLRPDEVLIRARAEAHKERFFNASGLWELSLEHNQVLDAIRPDTAGILSDVLASFQRQMGEKGSANRENAPRSGSAGKGETWLEIFKSTFSAQAREIANPAFSAELSRRAIEWSGGIEKRILDATAQAIGEHGFPTAVALLDLLVAQTRQAAAELVEQEEKAKANEAAFLGLINQRFHALRQKLDKTSPFFSRAAEEANKALLERWNGELFRFASALLIDVADGVLEPLRTTLRGASATLAAAERDDARLTDRWSGREVGRHLRPAKNQILLDPPDPQADMGAAGEAPGWPTQLDRLLEATFESVGKDAAEVAAVTEIVSGAWPSITDPAAAGVPAQRLITCRANWQATDGRARVAAQPARRGSYEITMGAVHLLRASRDWVYNRRCPVSSHIRETLGDWLDAASTDAAQRGARFAAGFSRACDFAAPLVGINSKIHTQVHGAQPSEPLLIMGRIPLGAGHEQRSAVEQILEQNGFTASTIPQMFGLDQPSDGVEISSFIRTAVHPVVLGSVMTPIQEEWGSLASPEQRRSFWEWRRTRPLTSFVPLAPSSQRDLVRGWFVARTLGQVDGSPATGIRVWTPRGWAAFPEHLLGQRPQGWEDVLPAVMESLPLAVVAFASGDPDALRPYIRLLDLGALDGDVPAALAKWIRGGEVPSAEADYENAPDPPEFAGARADSADQRREKVHTALSQTKVFEDRIKEPVGRDATLSLDRRWEVAPLALEVAQGLKAGVAELTLEDGDSATSENPFG